MIHQVDMGVDSSAPTVRATVVQASTAFYNTPATLGPEVDRLAAMAGKYKVYLVMGIYN
ncbi:hypothetical protein AAG906_038579 [Vitis piasezkii]